MAIIGRLSFDSEEILARTVLDRMLDASSREIIDPRGVFTAPGIALGRCGGAHDLGATPIGTSDHLNIRAGADSQLTNAGELRASLEREGPHFHTRMDAKLGPHAIDRRGTPTFHRPRGAFRFPVLD